MSNIPSAVLLLFGTLAFGGCGDSLDTLNRLAAESFIHEQTLVTAQLQIRIALLRRRCGDSGRCTFLAQLAEPDRERNRSRANWKRYPLAGAAI